MLLNLFYKIARQAAVWQLSLQMSRLISKKATHFSMQSMSKERLTLLNYLVWLNCITKQAIPWLDQLKSIYF